MKPVGLYLLIWGLLWGAHTAQAQVVITQVQPLRFGTFAMATYSSVLRTVVSPITGSQTYGSGIVPITAGQRAEFSMTGAPASTVFTITMGTIDPAALSGSPDLTLDLFATHPNPLQTNGAGAATFYFGARMSSAGTGAPYADGTYNGFYDYTIDF